MKISRTHERLPYDSRSDHGSVSRDQLSVGFVMKHHLREASHDQWINQAQQNRGRDCH
jgi:hypothetical protein